MREDSNDDFTPIEQRFLRIARMRQEVPEAEDYEIDDLLDASDQIFKNLRAMVAAQEPVER